MQANTAGRLTLISFILVAIINVTTAIPNSWFGDALGTTIEGARGTKGFVATRGGAIRLLRDVSKFGENKTRKTGEIVVTFRQLRELTANLTPAVDSMNKTHVISSFADQNFTCVQTLNSTMPHSTNVTADCLECWTNFLDPYSNVTFKVNACVIKNQGTVVQKDEVSNLTVGQLKFTVGLYTPKSGSWPWCDSTCRGGAGEFMDLDIGIKLPFTMSKKQVKTGGVKELLRPKKFDLGDGAMVEFSNMVLNDGVWKSLTHETPSLVQADGNSVITLRFPRFEKNLMYDPTVDTGDNPLPEGNTASAVTPQAMLVIGLLAVIGALAK